MIGAPIDIKKLADLCYLSLTTQEEEKFRKNLEKILPVLEELQSVDTTHVKPFAFDEVLTTDLLLEQDDSYTQEELVEWLRAQPFTKESGYVCVPHFQSQE